MAFDLKAVELTKGFVAPTSEEMQQALAKLHRREPLGTSDIPAALQAAVAGFGAGSTQPRAVVCIGDGLSRANLLDADSLENLLKSLVENRIPVSSYVVGANVDGQVPALWRPTRGE